jgi:peptidoglycan/xylan/chitin deacetylase (PgdA/CDA1 family)
MQVALTFDAGADASDTAKVLDTLRSRGLHCTFFLTGQFAETYPDLVRRISGEGHEIGNHSHSHPRFTDLSESQVRSELERTDAVIEKLTGDSTRPYFRFPYGAGSPQLVRQINSLGYLGVLWTCDTLDWEAGATVDGVRQRVRKYAVPGAIVLMHCGSRVEALALPLVIGDLERSGYSVVTLTQVLQ